MFPRCHPVKERLSGGVGAAPFLAPGVSGFRFGPGWGGVETIVQVALGQCDALASAFLAPFDSHGRGRKLDVARSLTQNILKFMQGFNSNEFLAPSRAARKALGVPGGVFPEGKNPPAFTGPVDQSSSMIDHDLPNTAEVRGVFRGPPGENRGQIREEPRPSETAPSYDDSIAPGGSHHAQGIPCFPDVPISEDRNVLNSLFEVRNRFPASFSRIQLSGGSGVKGDCRTALFLCHATCIEISHHVFIDAHPKFDRDGNGARLSDGGANDVGEQSGFGRNRGAASLARYFADRAAKIHVDVIDSVFVDEECDGLTMERVWAKLEDIAAIVIAADGENDNDEAKQAGARKRVAESRAAALRAPTSSSDESGPGEADGGSDAA